MARAEGAKEGVARTGRHAHGSMVPPATLLLFAAPGAYGPMVTASPQTPMKLPNIPGTEVGAARRIACTLPTPSTAGY